MSKSEYLFRFKFSIRQVRHLEADEGLVEEKSLHDCSSESDHGKTAVNDFGFLAERLLCVSQGGPALSFPSDFTWCGIIVVLIEVDSLNNTDGHENLDVSSESNRVDGSKNISVGELVTWDVEPRLLGNHTDKGKHADAAVLQFGPTSVVQVCLDIRTEKSKHRYRLNE